MTQAYLTELDIQNYGHDLVNMTQRAALHELTPQLQALDAQNAALEQQLAIERRHRLDMAVEQAVPDLWEIEQNPRWHEWLRSTHALSGVPRQHFLNDAIAAGNTSRVIAFFREFQRDAQAGQYGEPASSSWHRRAPRTRAGAPPSGQIWTRAQVKQAYELHRVGRLVGDAWARTEQEIINAGAQGRIANAITDIAGR